MSFASFAYDRQRKRPIPSRSVRRVWGLCVHTTGSTAVLKALDEGRDPFEALVLYYMKARFAAHYVLGWREGDIAAVYEDEDIAWHCGLANPDGTTRRMTYLSGEWKQLMAERGFSHGLDAWMGEWSTTRSPSHLYPSRDPNADYVGVELLPIVNDKAVPMRPGTLFTKAQHDNVVRLGKDLAKRHAWPTSWPTVVNGMCRLVGHEDIDPLTRADRGGLWDPGARRTVPRFDWTYVREEVSRAA